MSKRIIKLEPQWSDYTLSTMADIIHKDYGLRAEIFYSMYHKK